MWLLWSCHITFRCSIMTFVVASGFPEKGTSSRFLTHNFSCRRVNVLFLWCYVLTHKFSFHCEKDCLRSPDCEKTGQLAARKRYASERACFRPSTAQIPVKIYRSNAKSYSTNDTQGFAGRSGLWWHVLLSVLPLVQPASQAQGARPHGFHRLA